MPLDVGRAFALQRPQVWSYPVTRPRRARADLSTRSVFASSLSMLPSDAGKTRSEGDALIAAARCGRRAGATGMTSACPPFVVSRAYECLTVMVLSTRSTSVFANGVGSAPGTLDWNAVLA